VRSEYPGFNFTHSNGLGVLLVGEDQPEELLELDERKLSAGSWRAADSLFAALGERLQGRLIITELTANLENHRIEVDRLMKLLGENGTEVDRLSKVFAESQSEVDRFSKLVAESQNEATV
jgi:hypothetical protein